MAEGTPQPPPLDALIARRLRVADSIATSRSRLTRLAGYREAQPAGSQSASSLATTRQAERISRTVSTILGREEATAAELDEQLIGRGDEFRTMLTESTRETTRLRRAVRRGDLNQDELDADPTHQQHLALTRVQELIPALRGGDVFPPPAARPGTDQPATGAAQPDPDRTPIPETRPSATRVTEFMVDGTTSVSVIGANTARLTTLLSGAPNGRMTSTQLRESMDAERGEIPSIVAEANAEYDGTIVTIHHSTIPGQAGYSLRHAETGEPLTVALVLDEPPKPAAALADQGGSGEPDGQPDHPPARKAERRRVPYTFPGEEEPVEVDEHVAALVTFLSPFNNSDNITRVFSHRELLKHLSWDLDTLRHATRNAGPVLEPRGLRLGVVLDERFSDYGRYIEHVKDPEKKAVKADLVGEHLKIDDKDVTLTTDEYTVLYALRAGTRVEKIAAEVFDDTDPDYIALLPDVMGNLNHKLAEVTGVENSIVRGGNDEFGYFYEMTGLELTTKPHARPPEPDRFEAFAKMLEDQSLPTAILSKMPTTKSGTARNSYNVQQLFETVFVRLVNRNDFGILNKVPAEEGQLSEEGLHAELVKYMDRHGLDTQGMIANIAQRLGRVSKTEHVADVAKRLYRKPEAASRKPAAPPAGENGGLPEKTKMIGPFSEFDASVIALMLLSDHDVRRKLNGVRVATGLPNNDNLTEIVSLTEFPDDMRPATILIQNIAASLTRAEELLTHADREDLIRKAYPGKVVRAPELLLDFLRELRKIQFPKNGGKRINGIDYLKEFYTDRASAVTRTVAYVPERKHS